MTEKETLADDAYGAVHIFYTQANDAYTIEKLVHDIDGDSNEFNGNGVILGGRIKDFPPAPAQDYAARLTSSLNGILEKDLEFRETGKALSQPQKTLANAALRIMQKSAARK